MWLGNISTNLSAENHTYAYRRLLGSRLTLFRPPEYVRLVSIWEFSKDAPAVNYSPNPRTLCDEIILVTRDQCDDRMFKITFCWQKWVLTHRLRQVSRQINFEFLFLVRYSMLSQTFVLLLVFSPLSRCSHF